MSDEIISKKIMKLSISLRKEKHNFLRIGPGPFQQSPCNRGKVRKFSLWSKGLKGKFSGFWPKKKKKKNQMALRYL